MPKGLDAHGRKLWRTLTAQLHAMQLIGCVDAHVLTRYVLLSQRWQRLQATIDTHGMIAPVLKQRWIEPHTDSEGYVVPGHHEIYEAGQVLRPEVQVWLALHDRLARMEHELGMNPSARASIGVQLAVADRGPHGVQGQAPNPKRFLTLG
jgi:P27 family predicted phage terminase small subunit